ncbi:MAG: hypothetical protein K2W92_09625 [Alphaproteobacteria bacterium]|nr:hypothetical protein [Alphaproteobacteria bacterium]
MSAKMLSIFKKNFLKKLSIFVTLGITSCGNFIQPDLSIQSVSIYTDLDANQNSAVAVDLVLVYDDQLVKTFSSLSASKYFSSSPQLLLDNPSLVSIWHWELVPGQTVQDFQVQQSADAYAGFVFANYLTPGDHRLKVAPNGVIKILLLKDDLKNLVIYDTRNVTNGVTMSNTPGGASPEICDQGLAECTPPSDTTQPCQMVVPPTQQNNSACCNPETQGSAITTQPLNPLNMQQPLRPLNAQQVQQFQRSPAQNGQSTSRPYGLRGAAKSISKGTQNIANSITNTTKSVENAAGSISKTTQSVQKSFNSISQTPQNIKSSVSSIGGRTQAPKANVPSLKQSPIKPHANR